MFDGGKRKKLPDVRFEVKRSKMEEVRGKKEEGRRKREEVTFGSRFRVNGSRF